MYTSNAIMQHPRTSNSKTHFNSKKQILIPHLKQVEEISLTLLPSELFLEKDGELPSTHVSELDVLREKQIVQSGTKA